jgi:hypothetical protein
MLCLVTNFATNFLEAEGDWDVKQWTVKKIVDVLKSRTKVAGPESGSGSISQR